DPDGNAITFTVVGLPDHGSLSGSGSTLTYSPELNFNGFDSFTFTVNDGTSNSNVATISIEITPANDPPVANDQDGANNVVTVEDVPKVIVLSGVDSDGDPLTYQIVTPPSHGTLT